MTVHGTGTVHILLTASEAHGTGAGTTAHGTGTPGLILLGITEDGIVLGTLAGMILGTMADGMTHGITVTDMQDGTEASTARITADGTVAGIHIGTITTTIRHTTELAEEMMYGTDPENLSQAAERA